MSIKKIEMFEIPRAARKDIRSIYTISWADSTAPLCQAMSERRVVIWSEMYTIVHGIKHGDPSAIV